MSKGVTANEIVTEYLDKVSKYDERAYKGDEKEAEKIFLKQKNSIQAIKDTEGYKEIKKFWMRIVSMNQDMIINLAQGGTDGTKHMLTPAIKMDVGTKFINFLDNLENSD